MMIFTSARSFIVLSVLLCVGGLLLFSCAESPASWSFSSPESQHITLHHGEECSIDVQGVSDRTQVAWAVADTLVATVSDEGMLSGGFVGETSFTATLDGVELNGRITLAPRYQSYREPIFTGGLVTRQMIEQYETRPFEKEQPFTEHSILLRYKGDSEGIKRVVYIYNEQDNRLEQAYVELQSAESYTQLRIYDFLSERYSLTGIDSTTHAPDGASSPIFVRGNVRVKPMSLLGGTSFAIFYQLLDKE